ncbi:MAG TPA: BatA domain-containing protein [Candidatus Binatia bacterium]|nr:BatA domain-containing protein [Candidatus Binatia bacterium]
MNFLSPAFLIALPLASIPLIIHLLSKRQQKRISWGAMRFLMEAITRKRRLWRLMDVLLLLLRTAVFMFFILALARPLLRATWLGGSAPRDVILVLDQSMSMTRKSEGATLFELQMKKAEELLDGLKASDSVRVLLAGESPEWLIREPTALSRAQPQLKQVEPTVGGGDLLACVREAVELEAAKDKSERVVMVITDGQRYGWRMDDPAIWAALQTRIQKAAIPTRVNLHVVGQGKTQNLCVNRIESVRPFGAVNQSLTFNAQVQNRGLESSGPTLLDWRVNGESIGVATIPELGPGATTSVSVNHLFSGAGIYKVSSELEGADALAGDNRSIQVVEIFERVPILLVDDAPSADLAESESAFVMAAFGRRGNQSWRSVFEPTVVQSDALSKTNLQNFRCVILANTRRLAANDVDKLEAYAESGGGVWLALGSRTEADYFNEQVYRGGLGLAPMKVTEAIGDPNDREKFFTVRAASETHPATALLSDFQRLDLDRARIFRRFKFDPLSGKDVSVLLQVQHGDAVVVERKFGRGRVLVQSIPLGVSWSTLPLCQAYVAMLHEWLWYASEPGLPKRNLAPGEAIIEQGAGKAQITLPNNRGIELSEGRYANTRLPGEYALKVGGNTVAFNVQRSVEESDLKPLSDSDLKQIAANQIGVNGSVDAPTTAKTEPPRHPLERALLIALPFVLLGEMLLAAWSTQRRNLRVAPVSMT